MTPEARTHLEPVPESASSARRFVRDLLVAWDCDDPDEIAVLLTSEVVSNAIRHAADQFGVEMLVDLDDDRVRIEVRDRGAADPIMRSADSASTGGRGLLLVDALARRWGTERDLEGKVVWFEVEARRRRPQSS